MTLPPTDLPAWMRPRHRWIDWGLLVVIGIGMLLDWPLAVWPGLPGHTDAALFVVRAAEIAESLRSGTLYTRWAADFHFGFGSPLFNYLAPLPHYLSGLHQLITDANPVDSIKLGLALSVILAGVGMYQFVRQRYGQRAGLIAAVVYITSTPIAYALPVQSGNLAVLLSMALLPWLMAALDRLVRRPTRREWLTALVLLTAWSLTDTRMVVIGLPLIALVLSSIWPNREARIAVGWLLGAAALLTSFFWLPALVERDAVQWVPLADDPVGGSITLPDSLGGLPLSISTVFNPPIERGLGIGFSLTTVIGAATFIKFRRTGRWPIAVDFSRRRDVLAFGVVGLVAVLLTTPVVARYWMIATGWQPIRPYDLLLGLALPALTLVAAQAACCWPQANLAKNSAPRWRSSIAFALVSAPALLALLPTFTNVSWLPVSSLDAAVSVHTETAINAIDTLRTGMLLPIESYQPGTPLDRIVFNNPERDPGGPVPNLLLVNRTPLESRFTLSPLSAELNLTLDRLAFPGWFVVFKGVPAPNAVSSDGRMLFNIFNPTDTARGAELLLIFGDTPIRYLSWFLTGLGIFLAFGRFLVSPAVLSTTDSGISTIGLWHGADRVALAVVFGLFVVVFALLHLLSHRSSPALLAGSNTSTVATGTPTSSYPVGLASALIIPANVVPGSTLHITLLWHAFRPISADWELLARLTPVSTDPNAPAVTNSLVTQWHPGDIPTNQWPLGMLIRDPINIPLSTDIAPGKYYVQVAMAQCASPQRLPCEKPMPIQLTGNNPDLEWLTLSEPLQIEAAVGK